MEIYKEWRVSSHARAWLDDPQFVEEMKKTKEEPGRDASWVCLNGHTPNESQLPNLVAASKYNIGGPKARAGEFARFVQYLPS